MRHAFQIAVRQERGARRVLEAEQDFATEKSLFETVTLGAGHEVISYPKFYCELTSGD